MSNKNKSILCNVCGSKETLMVLTLPRYPLNSVFTENPSFKGIREDFDLYQCQKCNHVQALTALLPEDIYNDNYNFPHTASGVVTRKKIFLEHILDNFIELKFNRVIDIGCNSLSLLSDLKSNGIKANHFIGIDPAPLPEDDKSIEKIIFIQGFAEEVDIPFGKTDLPDLIVSDQVFEHIPNINVMLASFSKKIAVNSVFVISVPSLELLTKHYNFQMLIHEHVNYFTEDSLTNLFFFSNPGFLRVTSEFITIPHIGTLIQSFRLTGGQHKRHLLNKINPWIDFNNNFTIYKNQLKVVEEHLQRLSENEQIYGFGASYIVAILAYFMESDLSFLTAIIDDTPYKRNKYVPGVKPRIVSLEDVSSLSEVVIFITAPQASRAIMNRLIPLNPQMIVSPQFIS
ncbi:MAG: hypothetical protein ACJASR_000016 [Psychroserpens sp.]|jgi:hypothetical protein